MRRAPVPIRTDALQGPAFYLVIINFLVAVMINVRDGACRASAVLDAGGNALYTAQTPEPWLSVTFSRSFIIVALLATLSRLTAVQ